MAPPGPQVTQAATSGTCPAPLRQARRPAPESTVGTDRRRDRRWRPVTPRDQTPARGSAADQADAASLRTRWLLQPERAKAPGSRTRPRQRSHRTREVFRSGPAPWPPPPWMARWPARVTGAPAWLWRARRRLCLGQRLEHHGECTDRRFLGELEQFGTALDRRQRGPSATEGAPRYSRPPGYAPAHLKLGSRAQVS